jgi:hypothetical protein
MEMLACHLFSLLPPPLYFQIAEEFGPFFPKTNLYAEGDHSAICQSCIEDSPSTMKAENPVFQL